MEFIRLADASAGHFNHVGEPEAALKLLADVSKEEAEQPGVAFELIYALNATKQFDRAIETAAPALQRQPRDWRLCKELAFAYAYGGRPLDATRQYQECLAFVPEEARDVRAEIAYNLAHTYRTLAEPTRCREWLAKAKDWAPAHVEQRAQMEGAWAALGTCGG